MSERNHSFEPAGGQSSAGEERVAAFGRYELLRALGRGGMGQVFEAWDTQLERRVAIKILHHEHSDELALREARHLARVTHQNVVGVHEVGRFESQVFIAMELVEGADLRSWLCARPRRWTQVLDHLLAAAEGLAAIHRAGLIHGDVKPGNVLVGDDGRVCVADFGLARVGARVAPPELQETIRQAVAAEAGELDSQPPPVLALSFAEISPGSGPAGGTQAYMAPEHLCGEREPRARADQYSFCVMAWEVLFGVRPFAGDSAEAILGSIAAARLERGGGRPRGMPRAVEAVLRRGLSERAEDRWPSIEALLAALERARSRPRRWLRGALVIGLVLSMGGLVGAVLGAGARGGGFVDHVVCMTAGPRAVALARAGDGERALQFLMNAQLRASESQMRSLAIASQQVAVELQAYGAWEDAGLAWNLSVKTARVAGDDALELVGREGFYEAVQHVQPPKPPQHESR